jgi:hypothetical protein
MGKHCLTIRRDNRTIMRRPFLCLAALLLAGSPVSGQEACRLCYGGTSVPGERPLTIEIWTDLNFSRMAMAGRGGGSAEVDAKGGKRTDGGLIDLGGMAVSGRGRITGQPGREVRVDLPALVQMTSTDGAKAELTGFATDLPSNPRLNAAGELEFSFGARLNLHGSQGGNFRARIPISVDYN